MQEKIELAEIEIPSETHRALSQRDVNAMLENIALFRGCLDIVDTLARTMLQRNAFLPADVDSLEQELKNLQHVMNVTGIAFQNFRFACQAVEGSA